MAEPPQDPRPYYHDGAAALEQLDRREAARKIASDRLAHLIGAGGAGDGGCDEFAAQIGVPAIQRAQAGQLADLDRVADAVHGRARK